MSCMRNECNHVVESRADDSAFSKQWFYCRQKCFNITLTSHVRVRFLFMFSRFTMDLLKCRNVAFSDPQQLFVP